VNDGGVVSGQSATSRSGGAGVAGSAAGAAGSVAGELADAAPARPLRADARGNRARVLDAAEEVFARGGESASTEEVARLAGVGIATVFRHFPTKAALLEAVLTRRFGRLQERAAELVATQDPGQAFFDFFRHMAADAAGKIAIAEALAAAGGDVDGAASQASDELKRAVGVLLVRAQEAGAVRDDIGLPEIYALLIGSSRVAAFSDLDQDANARALAVIFDGLSGPRRRG
jgi:AcrR family transcriptional regulator